MKHTNFFQSLTTAFIGIRSLLQESRNARIQGIVFIATCLLGFLLKINATEWLWVLACSSVVLALEAVNTSMEQLADLYTTEYHPKIKFVKDIAAGSVLIASISALIIGLVIFIPHLRTLFSV
jgi:undecaprenol kinase